jgi:hypothetical protein
MPADVELFLTLNASLARLNGRTIERFLRLQAGKSVHVTAPGLLAAILVWFAHRRNQHSD